MYVCRFAVRNALVAVVLLASFSTFAQPAKSRAVAADPTSAHERALNAVRLHLPLPAAVLDGAAHTLTIDMRDGDRVVVKPEAHRIAAQTAAGTSIRLELQGLTRAVLAIAPAEMHARLRFVMTVDGKDAAAYTIDEMLANDERARSMKNVRTEAGQARSGRYEPASDRIVNHYYYPFTCPGTACSDEYTACTRACGRPTIQYPDQPPTCHTECQMTYEACSAGYRVARRVVETKLPDVRVVANECICDPGSYILTLGLNCFKYDSYLRVTHFEVYEDRMCDYAGTIYNVLVEEWDEEQFCYHKQKNSDGTWSGCQFGEVLSGMCLIPNGPRT